MDRRRCLNDPDNFCYICGQFTAKIQRRKFNDNVKKAYKLYFGCEVGDQDKNWAPHICCNACYSRLIEWHNGKVRAMPFAVPMIWREPTSHENDCYFCMTKIKGFTKKTRSKIAYSYSDCSSALKPVPHDSEMPVPKRPMESEPENSSDECPGATGMDVTYESEQEGPHLLDQTDLNDLIRDLKLNKEKSELLSSRLKEWNLLEPGTKVTHFRDRHSGFSVFYKEDKGICYCFDVEGLFSELDTEHKSEEWRLFIDSGKNSLKAVLLHNGNKKPSVPLACASGMKETYETMETLLTLIKYSHFKWNICGDLKVIALLLGLQLGYTKHMCFLCLWNSRDDANHYTVKDWPERSDFAIGRFNVKHKPLIDPQSVFLPPLHIKLGLIKNYVKAMKPDENGFKYLKKKFGGTKSDAKLKAGVFIGPEIRDLIRDREFESQLGPNERSAWQAFVMVVKNFLGNNRVENYVELVDNILKTYRQMGCRMSLKMHFLHSHLDFSA